MGEYAYSTHPDALMRSRIGWLTPQQLPDITSSGTYEIRPLETNDGQTKALVISLTSDSVATFDLQFVRRDDHGIYGSLNYSAQFSSDLVTFYDSATSPAFVGDSTVDSYYEVVKVPYPTLLLDGKRAAFGRVSVINAP